MMEPRAPTNYAVLLALNRRRPYRSDRDRDVISTQLQRRAITRRMHLSRFALALAVLAACSDDDDPIDTPLDGGVDSGARDASLDAQSPLDGAVDASTCADGGFNAGQGCRAMTTCLAGSYVSALGSATSDRMCLPCKEGEYSQVPNASKCVPIGQPPADSI